MTKKETLKAKLEQTQKLLNRMMTWQSLACNLLTPKQKVHIAEQVVAWERGSHSVAKRTNRAQPHRGFMPVAKDSDVHKSSELTELEFERLISIVRRVPLSGPAKGDRWLKRNRRTGLWGPK